MPPPTACDLGGLLASVKRESIRQSSCDGTDIVIFSKKPATLRNATLCSVVFAGICPELTAVIISVFATREREPIADEASTLAACHRFPCSPAGGETRIFGHKSAPPHSFLQDYGCVFPQTDLVDTAV